jgi:hypothetical protein
MEGFQRRLARGLALGSFKSAKSTECHAQPVPVADQVT